MGRSILGASVKRAEDPRFLTGQGRYLADLEGDDILTMVPVRSSVPHGELGEVDVEAAAASPGVVAVYKAGDLDVGPIPVGAPEVDGAAAQPLLASEKVRFVGDIIAVVVAANELQAADAADLVWPDIEPLPAISNPDGAAATDAPLLFPELGTNVIYDRGHADDSVLADADVVVDTTVVNQRVAAVPMEPNGALARPREDGQLDIWLGSQSAHSQQATLAKVLGMDRFHIHVKVPDVGGGFGAKIGLYPEQALCAAISLDLSQPVRWLETRRENMLGMSHGRAQKTDIRLGATEDGVISGVSMAITQDGGAYPLFGSYLPAISRRMAVGPYLIPNVEFRWRTVLTNTTPINAYRGAGRPEATMALERAIDLLADELDMDPAEVRRINFIPADEFPHVTAVDERYDSGAYAEALDLALETSDYAGWRTRQAQRRSDDSRFQIGVGVSSYVEITAPGGRIDWGGVEVDADGGATIYSGGVSQGHSHETTFPQVVEEILKIPIDRIRYVQGDTDEIVRGGGTMGSRSMQMAGSAVFNAGNEVLEKAKKIFAFNAEASPDDIVQFDDGRIGVVGVPDRALSLAELARLAADHANLPEGMTTGLAADGTYEQAEATFPFGTHVTVVEVDIETGAVQVLAHTACDDAGAIINRMVLDGQVHGGIGQGIGQALFEQVLYDEDANPITGNLTSYLIPVAGSLPTFTLDHTVTPTDQNPLGVKGIGEAGTIGSTPAIVNAVVDALSPFGIRDLEMPLTPSRVWSAIQRSSQDAPSGNDR